MKISPLALLFAGVVWSLQAAAADFNVTTPGGTFAFTINGTDSNPTLTLVRGQTYTFAVATSSFHPFQILSDGASGNNTANGLITYTVPMAASNYNYQCSIHHFMGMIITTNPPSPPPPVVQILSLAVDSNLTLLSTGTNTWSVIPEFNTNLTTTNWFALTVQTNRFFSGTNETICGRPPGDSVFIRIRSQPN